MTVTDRFLGAIERAGNRLPNPTVLFIILAMAVLVISALAGLIGVAAVHPVTGESISALNLLSGDGLRRIVTQTVSNFTGFAPLGTVLVAMLGIGIAEQSGLLGCLLRGLVAIAPRRVLTVVIVFAGVMSSMAADAGYVVLIPLAALAFISAGRHPVAGICAAFSGVSGGFSANLLIGPLDAILSGLSTSAAQIIDPSYVVNAAGNYYFLLASTLLITVLGAIVTEWIVEPRLAAASVTANAKPAAGADPNENAALRWVAAYTVVFAVLLALVVVPEQGLLRDPDTGSITQSPFISGIVVIVTLYVALAGWIYGVVTGNFRGRHGAIDAMEKTMATMAGYLVLMFFAAQFVAWFNWTNLGLITAIRGSELLRALDLGSIPLLLFFIVLAASVNLLIGSASAKWAIMAPVFIPMLMLLGISPEATQMAYRIGDSTTNIITPLMPYLALVLAFVQRYDRTAGIGTLVANMVPYSITFFIGWSVLLATWMLLGLPLGPGAGLIYEAGSP